MYSTEIIAGGFGSGKSEIALNMAIERAKTSKRVVLADLDLVNPFFASREKKILLEQNGIKLLSSREDLAFGDVPSVPVEIIGMLGQDNEMIIDLAGDEFGAVVLGYISSFLRQRPRVEFLLAVNPYRPFASSLEEIVVLKEYLERAAHLRFTGIISNPNLVEETTEDIIIEGHKMVEGYAQKMDLPIRYLTVENCFYDAILPRYASILKPIELNLRPEWL